MQGESSKIADQTTSAQDTATGSASKKTKDVTSSQTQSISQTKSDSIEANAGFNTGGSSAQAGAQKSKSSGSSSSESSSSAYSDSQEQTTAEAKQVEKNSLNQATSKDGTQKYNNVDQFERANDVRDVVSKSKNIRFKVDGGTDLEFTHRFYSDSFPEYFSKWLDTVILDPKSFNFKTVPIHDLLALDAFDFFPDCAVICGFKADSCQIPYPDSNGAETIVEFPCQEFVKITKKLKHKHSVLEDAVNLYLEHGKLIPINKQNFEAGPPGCSDSFWNNFEKQRKNLKSVRNLVDGSLGTASYSDLKDADLIEINFKLSTDLFYFEKTSGTEGASLYAQKKGCCKFKKELFLNTLDSKFLKYNQKNGKWLVCDKFGICQKGAQSFSLNNSEFNGENLVCFEFLCFSYSYGQLFVHSRTMQLLDNAIEKEKNFLNSVLYNNTEVHNTTLNHYYAPFGQILE